jgi:hypothetical protein
VRQQAKPQGAPSGVPTKREPMASFFVMLENEESSDEIVYGGDAFNAML